MENSNETITSRFLSIVSQHSNAVPCSDDLDLLTYSQLLEIADAGAENIKNVNFNANTYIALLLNQVDISEMAEQIYYLLQATIGHSRIILTGWSFGGFLAFAIKKYQSQKVVNPLPVILLDSDSRIITLQHKLSQRLKNIFQFFYVIRHGRRFLKNAHVFTESGWQPGMFFRLRMFIISIRLYELSKVSFPMILIRSTPIFNRKSAAPDNGWRAYCEDLRIFQSRGNHVTMMDKKYVPEIREIILSIVKEKTESNY